MIIFMVFIVYTSCFLPFIWIWMVHVHFIYFITYLPTCLSVCLAASSPYHTIPYRTVYTIIHSIPNLDDISTAFKHDSVAFKHYTVGFKHDP